MQLPIPSTICNTFRKLASLSPTSFPNRLPTSSWNNGSFSSADAALAMSVFSNCYRPGSLSQASCSSSCCKLRLSFHPRGVPRPRGRIISPASRCPWHAYTHLQVGFPSQGSRYFPQCLNGRYRPKWHVPTSICLFSFRDKPNNRYTDKT